MIIYNYRIKTLFTIFVCITINAFTHEVPAQQSDPVWKLDVHIKKNEYRLGEPILLDLLWTCSEGILMPPPYHGEIVGITAFLEEEQITEAQLLFGIAKEAREKSRQGRFRAVDPKIRGKKEMENHAQILLGHEKSAIYYSEKPVTIEWKYIFPVPGVYSIDFQYLSQSPSGARPFKDVIKSCKQKIKISEHASEKDRKAWKLYTPYAAGAYLGEYEGKYGTDGIEALKKILSEYPDSFYAAYAAVGLAKYKTRNNTHSPISADLHSEIESLLLPLSETHMDHPEFPEVAVFLVKSYLWQKDGHNKALEYVQKIADKDSDNPALTRIRDLYKITPTTPKRPPKYKVAKTAEPTNLIFSGLEIIPEGAKEVFRQDFENLAGCELSSPTLLLSGDYWGDRGKADMREYHRGWLCRTFNLDQWKISIDDAKTTDTYTRPRVIRAPQKTWEGEIVVVDFTMELNGLDRRSAEKYDRNIPLNTTALRKENDEWKIISEHTVDPTGRREKAMRELGIIKDEEKEDEDADEPNPDQE